MSLADRVAQWPEQWRQEGEARGHRKGVAEERRKRVAQERALLRRQTAVRFGDTVAGQVEDLLGAPEDWDRLAAAGESIVRAQTGADLIDDTARSIRQSG